MKKLIACFSICALFMACEQSNLTYQNEIDEVDDLITLRDSLQAVFDGADSTQIKTDFATVDSIHKLMVGPLAQQDSREYWTKTMADIEFVHRHYKKYLKDESKIRKNLQYSEKQLLSLRKSLKDEMLDSTKAKEYLEVENQAVQDISLLIGKRIGPAQRSLGIWDTAQSRYLEFVAKSDSLD